MILLATHSIVVETCTNYGADQHQFASPVTFARANVQPISGSSTQVSLGIEGVGMYTLYLDNLPAVDLARFTLGSKITSTRNGKTVSKHFFIQGKPTVNDSDTDLEHIEIVLKEDTFA